MKKKTIKKEEVPVAEKVVVEKPKASTKTSVTVSFRGTSRVYSKEAHGADFKDLAEEFAGKVGGEIA